MDRRDLLRRACETNFAYLALGNERFEAHGASFIINREIPRRHDANCVGLIRSESFEELEALLGRAEAEFSDRRHRAWGVDALAPAQVAARLALEDGYRTHDYLVHVLEGELQVAQRLGGGHPREIETREVLSDADWQAYRELDALWWDESSTGTFGAYNAAVHDEFMTYRKIKAPQARGWFACVNGVPRAFFSSWPGENGVGIIEDLYCHPEFRHRGLATALIVRAVADCRERGAGPVIINSKPEDSPKRMYAAMGFRPLFVHRGYTKRLDQNLGRPA
jgi:GNAT superfamily N-acetyltransferase